MSGQIRCGTLPGRFGPGILQPDGTVSKKWPVIPGFANVNVTSGSRNYSFLSPMKLGPFIYKERRMVTPWYPNGVHPGFTAISDTEQQIVVTNAENLWQGSKILPQDVINGIIQPSFYERRARMIRDPKPHRRPVPKSQGTPIAAYIDGQVLRYVPSRQYYIQWYSSLVQMQPEYAELVARLNNGEILQILGYDGYDPESGYPYGANPITYENLERAIYDPSRPFGHELVLCGLLAGIRPWENFDPNR